MAKYLLLKHYRGAPAPVNDVPMDQWAPDEVDAHIRFMRDFAARLESTGMPLGILPDTEYTTATAAALEPGDTVVLLTDGVVEAHGPDEVLFGTKRVLEIVKAERERPAREILNSLFGAVREHCGAAALSDDMTAILIKAAGEAIA